MAKPKRFSAQAFTQRLDQVISALIENKETALDLVQTDIQVRDIAQAFAVNSATLRRWCQEHTALSPRQYLAIYRVEQAKKQKYLKNLHLPNIKLFPPYLNAIKADLHQTT
jgi:AraC-like DNA-binding protein